MDLTILYEDSDILVIDKPTGISVSADQEDRSSEEQATVKNWVKKRYGYETQDGGAEDEYEQRYGIVHRLDKETSGVLLVAKNKPTFLFLKGLFKFRRIRKEYQVLTYGTILDRRFEITAPIDRNHSTGTSFTVHPDGRDSTTEFILVDHLKKTNHENIIVEMSYLKAFPKTGRTHQIRVHLKALGHPVVNDSKYAGRINLSTTESLFGRMMLHAKNISFVDWDGNNRYYESPVSLADFF